MQTTSSRISSASSFGFPSEVVEKIKDGSRLPDLIPEQSVSDLEFVNISENRYRSLKRLLDIILSLVALLILFIPMAIIALAIYVDDPGKIIFTQYRVGLHGKRFKIYKFRTMKQQTPKYLATAELDKPYEYITKIGSFLRKTSLDEIPQFINILKGDMSLVGPRPLISDEYEMHFMRTRFGVYNVRPGITGLAQINGRDLMTPEEKIHWDVRYLMKFGVVTDFKILFATIPRVLKRVGIAEGKFKEDIIE